MPQPLPSFSGGGTDTVLAVIGSDGSTVLEPDDNDGTFGGSSSSIAGTVARRSRNLLFEGYQCFDHRRDYVV